jgi:hypothetical protein
MRKYKPVRPKASHDARVRYAATLRSQGQSLRQIAAECGVSHETARRDLAEWDREQAKVSHLPVTKMPPGGGNVTPLRGGNVTATVTPLRRTS